MPDIFSPKGAANRCRVLHRFLKYDPESECPFSHNRVNNYKVNYCIKLPIVFEELWKIFKAANSRKCSRNVYHIATYYQ